MNPQLFAFIKYTSRIATISIWEHWKQVAWPLVPQFWYRQYPMSFGVWLVCLAFGKAYFQAKLANVYFTKELGRRCEAVGKKVTSVTLSPGFGKSGLYRDFSSCNLDVGRVFEYIMWYLDIFKFKYILYIHIVWWFFDFPSVDRFLRMYSKMWMDGWINSTNGMYRKEDQARCDIVVVAVAE